MQISYPRVPFPGVHYSQALWKLFTLERSCPVTFSFISALLFFILHSTGSFHALPALHLASIFSTWARSGDPLPVPAIGQVRKQNFSQTFTQAVSPALTSKAAPVDCHISGCIPTACSWQHLAVRNNHVCLETKLQGCTHAGTSSDFNPWKAKAFHTGFAHPGYYYTRTTFMLVLVLFALFFNVTALEAGGPATQFWTQTPCWCIWQATDWRGKAEGWKNEGIRGFQSFSGAFRLGCYPSKRRELWESLSPLGRRAVQHRRAARPPEARSHGGSPGKYQERKLCWMQKPTYKNYHTVLTDWASSLLCDIGVKKIYLFSEILFLFCLHLRCPVAFCSLLLRNVSQAGRACQADVCYPGFVETFAGSWQGKEHYSQLSDVKNVPLQTAK